MCGCVVVCVRLQLYRHSGARSIARAACGQLPPCQPTSPYQLAPSLPALPPLPALTSHLQVLAARGHVQLLTLPPAAFRPELEPFMAAVFRHILEDPSTLQVCVSESGAMWQQQQVLGWWAGQDVCSSMQARKYVSAYTLLPAQMCCKMSFFLLLCSAAGCHGGRDPQHAQRKGAQRILCLQPQPW